MLLSSPRFGAKFPDPAQVAATTLFAAGKPPPAVLKRPGMRWTPLLGRNDVYPDCVFVGAANAVRAYRWVATDADTVTVEQKTWSAYAACVGCVDTPAAIEATNGVDMLAALEWMRHGGLDVGLDRGAPWVPTWRRVDMADRVAIAQAADECGIAYVGVTLHQEDLLPNAKWNQAPYGPEVGGHCICAGWEYDGLADGDAMQVTRWGDWEPATWSWLLPRLRFAAATVWL